MEEKANIDHLKKAFQEQLQKMDNLVTKEDVAQMATKGNVARTKAQVKELTDGLIKRLEVIECQLLDVECKTNKTEKVSRAVDHVKPSSLTSLRSSRATWRAVSRQMSSLWTWPRHLIA